MGGIKVQRGERVAGDRLTILVKDEFGAPITPFSIVYSIFDRTGHVPILMGEERRPATHGAFGLYAADFTLDGSAPLGPWEIRWYIQRDELATEQVVVEEFEVISTLQPAFGFEASLSEGVRGLVQTLRTFLRDDCVVGDTEVEVQVPGGQIFKLTIAELEEIVNENP